MKRHIPNIITCCNLLCGCLATVSAINGNNAAALLFIVLGAGFDFFDGMSARLLRVSSDIGKELDSLADDITFGVAPASIIFYELQVVDYPAIAEPVRSGLPYFAYLVAAFSALRLANFNIDTRQTTSFIGLPTPANALFWGSLILCCGPWLEDLGPNILFLLLALMLFSCFMLVCELPMFALKFKNYSWKANQLKYIFAIAAALILIGVGLLEGWWVVITLYTVLSCLIWLRSRRGQTT